MTLPAVPEPTANIALLPWTGEVIDLEDTAAVAEALKRLREFQRIALADVRKLLEDVLAQEMERAGTKTLRVGGLTAKLNEKRETVYDVEKLRKSLTNAGLPEERINELITETVTYRVNGSIARSVAAANPRYERALKRNRTVVEKGRYVEVS